MNKLVPHTRTELERTLSSEEGLRGACLRGVTYHYLPFGDSSEYGGGGMGFDAGISAVSLDLGDRGPFTITWAMEGEREGLAVLGGGTPYAGLADKTLDASNREGWTGCTGDVVRGVGAAWQVAEHDSPDTPWALRLDFSERSVVLALGTGGAEIQYAADELVVIWAPSLAHAYDPGDLGDPAWGHSVS